MIKWTVNINESALKSLGSAIERAMKASALLVTGEVKAVLSGSRSGRRYKIPGTMSMYTASAAGEAPAVRLGNLRQSYLWETDGSGANTKAIIGSTLKYATYLEKGTSRISPRPHLSRAFNNSITQVQAQFRGLM